MREPSQNLIGANSDGVNDAAERNVISGNDDNGVEIQSSDNNVVAGNLIGTDVSGAVALGQPAHRPVWRSTPARGTRSAEPVSGAGDVISGNWDCGRPAQRLVG